MTRIEIGGLPDRPSHAKAGIVASVDDVRLEAGLGGLVILGPTEGALPGLDELLSMQSVEPVEALSRRVLSWKTAPGEIIELSRAASQAIRNGRTAVVYFDSHSGEADPIPENQAEFVCLRLSQLMVGAADVPAFVGLYGVAMAQSLIVERLGEERTAEIGSIADGCPLWQLTSSTMFPGLIVTMCPDGRDATAMVAMLEWLESRRS